ncbi:MAG: glycosyl hydrolase family 95 catalytic domain-containing protein, partial [Verrucomicrobiota bacterium]
ESACRHRLSVVAHCERCESVEQWAGAIQELARDAREPDIEQARAEHERWWRDFWDRSFIDITGDADADAITRAYQLQRYVTACAGRGLFPIKFNGSIFNVTGPPQVSKKDRSQQHTYNADYRTWGGGYWFQNTRLIYWPLLAAGDWEMMRPWFDLFEHAATLCRHRCREQLGKEGLFFPETMMMWGLYRNKDYGYERPGDFQAGLTLNCYIRRYWQGGLELSTLMLDYLAHTGDERWWREQGYPIVRDVVRFYHDYYQKRDESGRVVFEPSQSLETWHTATNPAPDIAGLEHVLKRLMALPDALIDAKDRTMFDGFLDALPPVPVERYDEHHTGRLVPAERYDDLKNMENGELYPVFPYPQGALGGSLHAQASNAWPIRRMRNVCGWMQDAVHAAMLGRAEEAAQMLIAALVPEDQADPRVKWRWLLKPQHPKIRFPGFFGPNFDWVPDQDHGCVHMLALQKMCLQTQHGKLRILPAWPKHWNVHFRLHAPDQTTVETVYRNGTLETVDVFPMERRNDVISD